jgi:hypothetical protein
MASDRLLDDRLQKLYCLSCRTAFELSDATGSCSCGRSTGRLLDDGMVQVQGPAKALVPIETVVRVDGGEWTMVSDDLSMRRVIPPAA